MFKNQHSREQKSHYCNSQTLCAISSTVKQILRLLHFHVYIYIYIHGTNKFLVKNDGIRGRSFVLSLEYIERQGGIFFLKPPKSRNICLSAVARSSCRWMYACYCLVYTRVRAHTTNGTQHLAPCFLIKVAPPVSLSLFLFDPSTALVLPPRWSTL